MPHVGPTLGATLGSHPWLFSISCRPDLLSQKVGWGQSILSCWSGKHCSSQVGWENLAESINHYITEHGYRLLHVGQQTEPASEGLWHSTVAVLGTTIRADELPSRPRAKVTMG